MNDMAKTLPDFMNAGWKADLGTHTFTAEEIIAFAKKFDPQPFHLDAEAAKSSIFGELCASGWHTAAIWMKKQRDFFENYAVELGHQGLVLPDMGPSPGYQNLRWLRPVFAGETIRYFSETIASRPSGSKPGWHIVTCKQSGQTETGKPVLAFESSFFCKPR